MSGNAEQRLHHRCEIIFSSSPVENGIINYNVSVNGVDVYGALGIGTDEIDPSELAKQMWTFDSALYAAIRKAAAEAFRSAALDTSDDFLPNKGRFRGELKVTLPGEEGRPKKGHESSAAKIKREREKAKERKKAIKAIRCLYSEGVRPNNKAALARQMNLGSESTRTQSLSDWLRVYGLDLQELIREALGS